MSLGETTVFLFQTEVLCLNPSCTFMVYLLSQTLLQIKLRNNLPYCRGSLNLESEFSLSNSFIQLSHYLQGTNDLRLLNVLCL